MATRDLALEEVLQQIAAHEQRHPEEYPGDSIQALFEAGVIPGPFSKEAGGRGLGLSDAVRAVEAIAAVSPSVALIASMPLGLAGVIAAAGEVAPDAQRAAFREQTARVAADYRQRRLYAACNSEKGAGGSLAATQTHAARQADGSFAVTGEKILASGGCNAATFFSTAKVSADELPDAGVVELFFVDLASEGVEVLDDWDGFGMRATESHTVRYSGARAREMLGFPNFLSLVQPLEYWFCLFAAIPLGCAKGVLRATASPAPQSPALKLRLSEATMRYEAARAYLLETAERFRPAAGPGYAARVLRTKTYVSQEATRLCAELFALSGGRNFRRTSPVARLLADSFAGTSLRPPLALSLDRLVESFSLGEAE
ncbi:MAG: acyl-CoA/acyl-ACP dehydrogenase [Myxococcota bacterium]|nr:acyl-CoA/acyl-ACP dehydrogenase [Myxococcota bacterium]